MQDSLLPLLLLLETNKFFEILYLVSYKHFLKQNIKANNRKENLRNFPRSLILIYNISIRRIKSKNRKEYPYQQACRYV